MNIKEESQKNTNLKEHKITINKLKCQIKGITLIALVVTIIVLLILAGVAINLTIGDNGIFKRAEKARDIWEIAQSDEQSEMDKAADFIERYENENRPLNSLNGEETSNSIVYDKYGNKVVVPAGFKIINPEDDVTKGIVIEDVNANGSTDYTKGSQFVWIPVGNVYIDENQNYDRIILGRYAFDFNTGKEKLVQPAERFKEEIAIGNFIEVINTNLGNTTAKNLEQFIKNTIKNKGYYIGRYEAVKAEGNYETENEEENYSENSVNEYNVCIKQGFWTYRHVTQAQAADLSRNMYSSDFYESDLINSYAWDTALVYIQKFSGDEDYSIQIGSQTPGTSKTGSTYEGGESDLRCNIYDLAGNVREWSTETCVVDDDPNTLRGGWYYVDYHYACSRNYVYEQYQNDGTSFRVILYLN